MSTLNSSLTITQLSNHDEGEELNTRAYRLFRLEEFLLYDLNDDIPSDSVTGKSGPLETYHDFITIPLPQIIIVPKLFISDGPSIPRLFWWFLDVFGRYSRAGFIHDYLCLLISIGRPHKLAPDRRAADRIFRQAVRDCGTPKFTTFILYIGVSLGRWLNIPTTMAQHNRRVIEMMGTDGV